MKPPTMMRALFGIIATASSADTAFMTGLRQSIRGGMFQQTLSVGVVLTLIWVNARVIRRLRDDQSQSSPATVGYTNCSMQQHALDMLAALDALQIPFCHLATHSTGGIIAARMLLMQPERFGQVFALDPVTPLGLAFSAEQIGLFRAMMASREVTRAMTATAASSLFLPDSIGPGAMPVFREGLGAIQALFERILDQTFGVSEGVWIGTPVNLTRERENRELERRMSEIRHPHLVVWGERDGWIAPDDLRTMEAPMPNCRLVIVPGVGHSMNLEKPPLYAG
ncbi:alpha/beta fold hydrolase [Bradyrhizobium sp. ma5]|uniref:alpha/beta fold hydrolase n=1 Tax=Bradyrhizobium sp. ma5 TaxID=3344828 RepID=UPI0035D51D8E